MEVKSPFYFYAGLILIFLGVINMILVMFFIPQGDVAFSPGETGSVEIPQLGLNRNLTFGVSGVLMFAGVFFLYMSRKRII